MLIKWEDFTVHKADWNHKHENLRAASRELGLALDSFVFIDDSDYEREQMRQLIPEVLVLNKSGDPLEILRSLWETDLFDCLSVTAEDRQRHHDYAVRKARNINGSQGDVEEFLKSLQIEATIEEIGPSNLERVVTILGKTNQFNLTARRHSRPKVQAILEKPDSIALALRLRDRFGDQGIVGVLLALAADAGSTLIVDSFLVSCRALGRGVEVALWSAMLHRAGDQNVHRLEAEYIRTARNAIVADLYDRFGLRRVREDPALTSYILAPVNAVKPPSWISMNNDTSAS